MHLFFVSEINGPSCIFGEEESRHAAKVLRLKEGEIIHLTDGKGKFYKARLIMIHPRSCEALIIETIPDFCQKIFKLHIAIAPTKSIERFEWFLEKATEIGIDEITPLLCEHSEREVVKLTRLEKVMISAMKQSLKATLPLIHEPEKFKDLILKPFSGQKFIAYCETDTHEQLHRLYQKNADVLILIGPEGDFSPAEVDFAQDQGFTPVSFGPSRLRTETAGIVACHTVNLMNS